MATGFWIVLLAGGQVLATALLSDPLLRVAEVALHPDAPDSLAYIAGGVALTVTAVVAFASGLLGVRAQAAVGLRPRHEWLASAAAWAILFFAVQVVAASLPPRGLAMLRPPLSLIAGPVVGLLPLLVGQHLGVQVMRRKVQAVSESESHVSSVRGTPPAPPGQRAS